ncbi:MAG: hypothetical protein JXA77_09065 [Bacteroidales bacterium]|nr:hypothetical protein [Bacteroidales bacterium]MBN2819591.1 hypothetical protein [Bacteroidales bacterium]
MKRLTILLLAAFTAVQIYATQREVTLTTDNYSSPTVGMLRYWINNANDGDTIVFSVSNVDLDTTIRLTGIDITIDGGSGVVLDVNSNGRVFNISSYGDKIVLKNLTIQNGRIDGSFAYGGGMYAFESSAGDLIIENCTFQNNIAVSDGDGQGGALRTQGGTYKNCFFLNNQVTGTNSIYGGGGIQAVGGTFINCVIAGNSAGYGGGIFATEATIYNCTITQNEAANAGAGGGIDCENNCIITNCIVYNNITDGVENNIDNYQGTSTVSYCAVEDGNTIVGSNNNIGLLYSPFKHTGADSLSLISGTDCQNKGTSSGITVLNTDIAGNTRVYNGTIDIGAYELQEGASNIIKVKNNAFDPAVLFSLPWAINQAESGDTIMFVGDYTISVTSPVTLGNKTVTIDGSGYEIILDGDAANGIIEHNGASGYIVSLKNLTFQNGNATYGGGLYSNLSSGGYIRLENCRFLNNMADWNGGGAYFDPRLGVSNSVLVKNCVFANNSSGLSGGGLYSDTPVGTNYDPSVPTNNFINCTFFNNTSFVSGGGAAYFYGFQKIINCLFYENQSASGNDVIFGSYSKFINSAADQSLDGTGNIQLYSTPFIIGTLQLNDSTNCINSGIENIDAYNMPETDVDGNPRIQNGVIDIGAYESSYLNNMHTEYSRIVVNNDSYNVQVENSILWALNHIKSGGEITFNNDYTINVTNPINLGDKNITINGGENRIIFDGGDSIQIFRVQYGDFSSNAVINISNLVIRHGDGAYGGGLFYYNSSSGNKFILSNCMFLMNTAIDGGGLYSYGNGSILNNCIFIANTSASRGGGAYVGSASIRNCSFYGNHSNTESGGLYIGSSTLVNSVIYGNTSDGTNPDISAQQSSTVTYCASGKDITAWGTGNILLTESPFDGSGLYDSLDLKPTSVLIDAGNNAAVASNMPETDFSGNARFVNTSIDIGAFENYEFKINTVYDTNGIITPGIAGAVAGGNVAFTIIPNTGCSVDSVWIDGIYADSTDSYTFINIQANHTIEAGFKIDTLKISVNQNTGGTYIIPDTTITYFDTVVIKIYPDTGYTIKSLNSNIYGNVTNNLVDKGDYFEYTKTKVTSDNEFTISYEYEAFAYTVNVSGNGTANPTSATVYYFTDKYFRFYPGTGYYPGELLLNGVDITDSLKTDASGYYYLTKNTLADGTLDVTFEVENFNLGTSCNSFGAITPAGRSVTYFDAVDIIFTPNNERSVILSATLNGQDIIDLLVEENGSYVYELNSVLEDISIVAEFSDLLYKVKSQIEGSGTITLSDTILSSSDILVAYMKPDTGITITAASYGATDILNDLIETDTGFVYQLTGINSDDTLFVNFQVDSFNVFSAIEGEGTVISNPKTTYFDTLVFTITPETGYLLQSVQLNGVEVLSDLINKNKSNTLIVIKPTSDVTLNVVFTEWNYHIAVYWSGDGNVTPAIAEVGAWDSVAFTLTPEAGDEIISVTCGGINVLNELNYHEGYATFSIPQVVSDTLINIVFSEFSGLPSIDESMVKVYPNPASEILNIQLDDTFNSSEFSIHLYTLTGELVYSQPYNSSYITVSLEMLGTGEYIIIGKEKTGTLIFMRPLIIVDR